MDQQERALDVILAKDPEHADIRVALYFKVLTERGFRRAHYTRFKEHFIDALRENWETEDVIVEASKRFERYVTVFDTYTPPDPYFYGDRSATRTATTHTATTRTAATKRTRSKRTKTQDTAMDEEATTTPETTPETRPKKSFTSAIQQTPNRIRALKDKLKRHMLSPKPTAKPTAAPLSSGEGETTNSAPPLEQKKKISLMDITGDLPL
jgi:hypothetical protein